MERNQQELGRILALIEERKISPEEGDRLIASLGTGGQTVRCPYCAEDIAPGLEQCPECMSSFQVAAAPPFPGRSGGLDSMGGLAKYLVLYTMVVTVLVVLTEFRLFFSPVAICRVGLAGLGLASAILICRGSSTGWVLGTGWAALQIPMVMLNHAAVNRQVFTFHISWSVNSFGFGINLVGILLLILFLKANHSAVLSGPSAGKNHHTQGGSPWS